MYQDDAALLDIANAARLIAGFLRGVDRDAFLDDPEKQSAVLFQVAVIGEAVKLLSAEFRNQHNDIPWRKIAGSRDRAIHGYRQINLITLWDTATESVPDLLARIEPLLATLPSADEDSDPS